MRLSYLLVLETEVIISKVQLSDIVLIFIRLVNFVTFSVFSFGNRVWLNLYKRALSGNETCIRLVTCSFYFYYEDVRAILYSM